MSADRHLQGAQFNRAPNKLPTDSPRPSAADYELEAYRNRPVDTSPHVANGPTGQPRPQPSYSRRVAPRIGPDMDPDSKLV